MWRVGQRFEKGDNKDMLEERQWTPLVLDKVNAVQDRMHQYVGAAFGIPTDGS
jgi:hypothetical protein